MTRVAPITRRDFLGRAGVAGVALAALPRVESAELPSKPAGGFTLALVGGAHSHTGGIVNVLKNHKEAKIKYVWDPNAERGNKWAKKLGSQFTADDAAIWTDPEIRGVVIFSETSLHRRLALAAAKARKHLFIEKPLATNGQDARDIAHAIEQAGVLFATGYAQRSSPVNLFIKSQIEQGHFGTVTRARASVCHDGVLEGKAKFDTDYHWFVERKLAGVGGFGDLGTHGLDILMWMFGDVREVSADIKAVVKRYPDCDECGEGLLRFKSGVTGTLAAGWVDVANPVSFLVSGTLGHAVVFNGQLYFKSSQVPGADGTKPWTDLPQAPPPPLEQFLLAVGGQTGLPLVTPREAADRVCVMEALYRSSADHRWLVPR
jgi:predicted dehydrogenase